MIDRYLNGFDGNGINTVELSLGLAKPMRTWTLPEELLCDHSSYFRATFQGEFKEGFVKKSLLDEELLPRRRSPI